LKSGKQLSASIARLPRLPKKIQSREYLYSVRDGSGVPKTAVLLGSEPGLSTSLLFVKPQILNSHETLSPFLEDSA
jgi:hypothetical protein